MGVDGGGMGMGVSHACMHTHTCMYACRHTCMLNMLNMDAPTLAAICNFYTCIHVCAFVCMHAHVCAHVWRHPHAPDTPTHLPPPQRYRELFTPDTPTHLPHTPPPRAEETQIGRITITFEWIKIIQFCLKIWDPWTLLHTYRLDLMCRWRGILSQKALLSFLLLWPSDKNFSCFCTGSH